MKLDLTPIAEGLGRLNEAMLDLSRTTHTLSGLLARYRQVRFPKSKRKRIRKRWARDPRNWAIVPTARAGGAS